MENMHSDQNLDLRAYIGSISISINKRMKDHHWQSTGAKAQRYRIKTDYAARDGTGCTKQHFIVETNLKSWKPKSSLILSQVDPTRPRNDLPARGFIPRCDGKHNNPWLYMRKIHIGTKKLTQIFSLSPEGYQPLLSLREQTAILSVGGILLTFGPGLSKGSVLSQMLSSYTYVNPLPCRACLLGQPGVSHLQIAMRALSAAVYKYPLFLGYLTYKKLGRHGNGLQFPLSCRVSFSDASGDPPLKFYSYPH